MAAFFKKRQSKKFGEIAIDKGLVSHEDVTEALAIQEEYKKTHNIHKEIGAILVEKGTLSNNDVKIIIDEQKNKVGMFVWFSALFNLSR